MEYFGSFDEIAPTQGVGRDVPDRRPQQEHGRRDRGRVRRIDETSVRRDDGPPPGRSRSGRAHRRSSALRRSSAAQGADCRVSSDASLIRRAAKPSATLRGLYFSSGTQEGTPIDQLLGTIGRSFGSNAEAHLSGTGKSFFLHDLLTKVIFAESGWVSLRPVGRKARRNRQIWQHQRDRIGRGSRARHIWLELCRQQIADRVHQRRPWNTIARRPNRCSKARQ